MTRNAVLFAAALGVLFGGPLACASSSPLASAPAPAPDAPDSGADGSGCPPLSHATDEGCRTTLEWTELPTGPESRDHHATFLFAPEGADSAMLYASGGLDEVKGNLLQDLWYTRVASDGSLEQWKKGPAPSIWQSGHGTIVVGSRAYLVSGKTFQRGKLVETAAVTSLKLRSDGAPEAWHDEKPLPAPRFHGAATAVGNAIFFVGGLEKQPGKAEATVYRADLASDGSLSGWIEATALPEPRSHHALFAHRSHVFVLGGLDGSGIGYPSKTYNDYLVTEVNGAGELGAWRRVELPFGLAAHSATVVGDYVYLFGGITNADAVSKVVRRAAILADGALGEWETMTPLPFARAHVHHTPAWQGFVFSVGGNTGDHKPTNRVVGGRLY